MEIINLPEDLSLENDLFAVYDYTTSKESLKQMVTLQKNTFSFLINGSKEVFSNKKNVSIQNDYFLLMKKGRCLMTEKIISSDSDTYRSILFFFSNETILNFIKNKKISFNKNPELKSSVFSFSYDAFIKSFVSSLIEISKLSSDLQFSLLASKFDELLTYLITVNGSDFIDSLLYELHNENHHFIEVIETNKLNKLTLKELSFLSNMSLSSFKREFQKHFQTSPSKWFLEQRLEHSAILLQDKSVRPTDIFEEIGYENLSNFIQAFKLKFGMTPKQYQSS
ncbi:AraC family transcriptional regulator [Tenacibaculum sp. SZ-18]|uniref:helix-turn-helix domain-containing protein n=1 Tax=Tenacibaculum sp. SZ-18 TaxID=754423 RepID=UPI000C2D386D|nr:AraC family transcriptional regulator [Tenacibaculum sp. SZ-18]AUC16147.1 AraC family transcriptional regulator [Tenacibaculum sp. SZ-18]